MARSKRKQVIKRHRAALKHKRRKEKAKTATVQKVEPKPEEADDQ